jgi:hypothetical protein
MALNAGVQVSFFFTDVAGADGWTENMYLVPPLDNASALANAQALAPLRVAMLHTDYILGQIRVSQPGKPRDALIANYEGTSPFAGTQSGKYPVDPWTALLVRFENDLGSVFALKYVRGVPDRIFGNEGLYTPDAEWTNALAPWRAAITAATSIWCFQSINPTASTQQTITTMKVNEDPHFFEVGIAPAALSILPGTLVAIRGLRGNRQIERYWRVAAWNTVPSPPTYVLGPAKKPVGLNYTFGGTIRTVDYLTPTIRRVVVERFVEHKIGRPFNASHGRRSA